MPGRLAAKRSGLIHSVEPVLIALTAEGYRLTDALVAEILRLAGEVSPMPVTSRPWS
jgi:predicted nucleic acid-binding protein